MLHRQLFELRRRQRYRAFSGRNRYLFAYAHSFERCRHCPLHSRRRQILQRHRDLHIRPRRIGQGKCRYHLRIADLHHARRRQRHRLPDARITITNSRHPIPALGRHERRTIQAHQPAVLSRASLDRLLMRNPRMRWRRHPHRKHVRPARLHHIRHIGHPADERPRNCPQRLAIHPHRRVIINSLKGQRQPPPASQLRCFELYAVPIILLVQRLGNRQVVQPVIRIGIHSAIHQRGEHRAWHRRHIPVFALEAILRDGRPVFVHLGRGTHPPPARNRPRILSRSLQCLTRFLHRNRHRLRRRRFRPRHRLRILWRPIPGLPAFLHPPLLRPFLERDDHELRRCRRNFLYFIAGQCVAANGEARDLPAEMLPLRRGIHRRRHLQRSAHAAEVCLTVRDLRPIAIKMKRFPVERRCQQVPLSRLPRERTSHRIVFPHPQRHVRPVHREIPRILFFRITHARDQHRSCDRLLGSHPRVHRPRRICAQHGIVLHHCFLQAISSRDKHAIKRAIKGWVVGDGGLRGKDSLGE